VVTALLDRGADVSQTDVRGSCSFPCLMGCTVVLARERVLWCSQQPALMCSLFPCLLSAVLQADGNSALLIAAAEGHADVVMALINHHAAVNQEDVRAAYTVWTHACACNSQSSPLLIVAVMCMHA
jgi:hypothetical protein